MRFELPGAVAVHGGAPLHDWRAPASASRITMAVLATLLLASCHRHAPPGEFAIDGEAYRGCTVLQYADTAAAAGLPRSLALLGMRAPGERDSTGWHRVHRSYGQPIPVSGPRGEEGRWRSIPGDSIVVEWMDDDAPVGELRLLRRTPGSGMARLSASGAQRILFATESSSACYPYRL